MSGSEAFTADQVNAQLQVRIIIRYDSTWKTINSTWRVVNANTSKKYDISSVMLPEQRSSSRADIEMLCFESERDDE